MGQVFKIFFLFATVMLIDPGAFAQDTKTVENGRKIFIEKRCYTCHTIQAEADLIEKEKEAFAKSRGLDLKDEGGDDDNGANGDEKEPKLGGDLSHVGAEREGKWIMDFIQKPKGHFKDSSDCKRKAKKKERKRFKGTEAELEILVGYISGLKYPEREKKTETCLKE